MTQQRLVLDGALTMETVAARLAEGRALAGEGGFVVDFSAVTECDSAALALLFDWMRAAGRTGAEVGVRGLPAGLLSLAELYGVAELLPRDEAAESI